MLLLCSFLVMPITASAKVGIMGAYKTVGTETAGDLANVDCSDRDGQGTDLNDGDMFVVVVEGTDGAPGTVSFWKFISNVDDDNCTAENVPWDCCTGSGAGACEDGEGDTAYMIFPKNQAGCTVANQGAFIKVSSAEFARSVDPGIILRDLDATDADDNFSLYISCSDGSCATTSEDVDVFMKTQVGGVLATVLHIDCDASGNCDVDLIPQGTGKVQNNGVAMPKIIASGATALDFASTATGNCATVIQASATNVVSTDTIIFNPNASIKAVTGYVPAATGGFSITAFPTSGYVNFEGCNWTAGTVDPGSITVNWMVIR